MRLPKSICRSLFYHFVRARQTTSAIFHKTILSIILERSTKYYTTRVRKYNRVLKIVPLRPNDPIMTQKQKNHYSALSFLFSQAIHSYAHCFLTPYSYEVMAGRRTFIEFSVEAHGSKTLRA